MGFPLDNICNAVLVCINQLIKLVCLVPRATGEGEFSAAVTARLFMYYIVQYFGFPYSLILFDYLFRDDK